jgi:regulator of replication initiation timing
MSPPPAVAHAVEEPTMTDNYILAQLLERMGELLADVGGIKERLNHGQKNFETMRQEHTVLREMLAPVVTKVTAWTEHVEAAKETTKKFETMEPEFAKMKTVTARFLTVAMIQGSVVGAALWGITLIWPVVWGYIKTHIQFNGGN